MVSMKPEKVALEQGIKLPTGYHAVKDLNLVNLRPWHLVSDEEFAYFFSGINKRYPRRSVIPFARREDSDDVACFVCRDPEQEPGTIIVMHDFASPGYENVARIQTFWEWFKYAVDEMINWYEAGT